ncbi:DOG1 domain-containing protein [Artemisia annua]|uniref:DOG1 domain-containing protein n=1 Tax=Artemisia annua TaxID=35608 RepID=A0A2U1PXL8_ARTAN|nr:DOG1 domain-containing protein [Artemisia annua]
MAIDECMEDSFTVRKAQLGFVHKVGSGEVTAAVAAAEMEEEMVGIVMDANRLRKDVISEIVSFTNVYQGALFLEGVRKAQLGFVHKVGSGKVTAAVAAAEMEEEMVGIVMDANRLRKDVISEIVSFTNVYQGALFLEGLAQFLVGFRDGKLLNEFKNCKSRIN